jgi:ATP-dependent helicase HrpA
MADARIDELKTVLPRCLLHDWVRLGARLVRLLRDHHHAGSHDAVLNRLLAQARASAELCERRRAQVPPVSYPPDLPITARKDEIVAAIRKHQIVIIAGETGSGKTTQLPKMCLEAGLGIEAKIGCTQPRRVAALSISRRIAEELNVDWGREVGCKIRFDDRSSPNTYIKLMTDGILLAETQGDPLLAEYNAIIIDEAHERSLNIDFLLGYLKGLTAKRPELKLIITSATIDTEAFSRAFDNAPIIEVSGRMFPVEVQYAPFDSQSEETGDMTYIDAAVQAAVRVIIESDGGDVLVFMPTERDIRETSDLLENRLDGAAEIIPLFGRLSAGDQQRVFAPTERRKIVVATNIAETSLTIPNIRYVIDAGLARISRYNPRTRTKRLPVEAVSQSSANQRKGRSGRVRDGVCIRLYSEEDFNERPPYTQPEIQRANLAEVILRMKAFRLGEIDNFPFINPPTPAAIHSGYKLLQELGALDEGRALTPLGANLARLPIDPTLGRMLLQSQHEHATRELLIIASGLSIQDPRERPLEQKEVANAAHKRFQDARSDFLTLLNIWNAFHEQWEKLRTQNQRRKFCKTNFLSYMRMREWQDLHAQLHFALEDLGSAHLNESNAAYEAVHRSILSGLLGHVACREERNQYKSSGNRQLIVFPGSALFDRNVKIQKVSHGKQGDKAQNTSQPQWIVAGEIVETSQLFARTVAGIDPQWIVELAPHLCKLTYHNPHWSPATGKVLATEKATLYGLEVQNRKVAYGNINPGEATEIFIRGALVEEDEDSPEQRKGIPLSYPFLLHNRQVRNKIEVWRTRTRAHGSAGLDEALFDFYSRHIQNVSSLPELSRLLYAHPEPNFLCVTEGDLIGGQDLSFNAKDFPDAVPLGGQFAALSYAYAPGEEKDGVTIQIGLDQAQNISTASVQWAVPGLREEQAAELLRALPKSIRRELMPLPQKAAEIARDFHPQGESLLADLAAFIRQKFGVLVPVASWRLDALPAHLRPRIEVVGHDKKTVTAGRDLDELRKNLADARLPGKSPEWRQAAQQWERFGLTNWSFGDLPERIKITELGGVPIYAWPGLQLEDGAVSVRLFPTPDAARAATLPGVGRLIELIVQKDLGWLEKDLRALAKYQNLYGPLGSIEELQNFALQNAKCYILPATPLTTLAEAEFNKAVESARQKLQNLAPQLMERIGAVLQLRQDIASRSQPPPPKPAARKSLTDLVFPSAVLPPPSPTQWIANELRALVPKNFLEVTPFEQLQHLPRYLKALLIRIERAALNPIKDQERQAKIAPYLEVLRKFQATPKPSPETARQIAHFRWMIEEYKVSLYAQELGTAFPVSPKRLDQEAEALRQ